jgi:hypothetical protein
MRGFPREVMMRLASGIAKAFFVAAVMRRMMWR